MLTVTHTTALVTDVLRDSFAHDAASDYWFPMEPGTPLVRVYVTASGYQIERRRDATSPWIPLVAAALSEFDAQAFRAWRASYPVVAN